ncbi:MAG: SpoIID/LytB domain-containing protein, partial [Oscillospiraceae bacterium]|nr:SpoIID/LytB domain-containing protein [Oscillospiraceae bacterium]
SQPSSSQQQSSQQSSQKPSSENTTTPPSAAASAHTTFFNLLPLNVDTPTPAPTVKYLSNTVLPTHSDSSGEVLRFKSGSTTYSLPVKEALKHVVANEMNNAMTLEAIKSQVVATHTYIKFYNDNGDTPSVGYKSTIPSKVNQAVEEVYNIIMTYNGKAIYSPYHACSAGSTQSSKEVWGGARAYLVAVESKYDYLADTAQSKAVYKVNKTISEAKVKAEIQDHLGVTPSGDPSTWFQFHDKNNSAYTSGNYINKITIAGKTTTGKNVRSIFGLRSACFDVKYSNGKFVFTTKGYGHGVGMSQWGAHFYAIKQGWNFEKIVCHYYKGVTLAKVA